MEREKIGCRVRQFLGREGPDGDVALDVLSELVHAAGYVGGEGAEVPQLLTIAEVDSAGLVPRR
jgi:hypothetical protein